MTAIYDRSMNARAVLLLIRHAMTDAVGVRLTSRLPGVHVSAAGLAQLDPLHSRLRGVPLAAIYSSPLERTMTTADAVARGRGIPVRVLESMNEVDFGDWTGLTFAELDRLPAWRRFNEARGGAPVPNGETADDVQRRVMGALGWLAAAHAGETVAVVSHGDVIRNAVLAVATTPLDLWHRFEISPASITTLVYENGQPRLLTVNERPASPPDA
jgi:probable phosphoglycerate mutase